MGPLKRKTLVTALKLELKQTTTNAAETRALGARLSSALQRGDLVLLAGELGAGKTTLIQGIAEGAGCRGLVNSPTFVITNEYRGRDYRITHCDFYRLTREATSLEETGIPDYLDTSVVLVEWAERNAELAEYAMLRISLSYGAQPNARQIQLTALNARGAQILQTLPQTESSRA